MDLAALNRDPALRRSPYGRIELRWQTGEVVAYVDDGITRPRQFAVLAHGECVYDLTCGADPMAFGEVWRRARAQRADREAHARAALASDMAEREAELARHLRRHGTDPLIAWLAAARGRA